MTCPDCATSEVGSGWIQSRQASRETSPRASVTTEMQLAYDAGAYHLDLLVRELVDSAELKISGRITFAASPDKPAAGLKVWLVSGEPPVTESRKETDEFGETEVAVPRRKQLWLCIGDESAGPRVLVWGEDDL